MRKIRRRKGRGENAIAAGTHTIARTFFMFLNYPVAITMLLSLRVHSYSCSHIAVIFVVLPISVVAIFTLLFSHSGPDSGGDSPIEEDVVLRSRSLISPESKNSRL
jgi:hypothetical protein